MPRFQFRLRTLFFVMTVAAVVVAVAVSVTRYFISRDAALLEKLPSESLYFVLPAPAPQPTAP